MRYAEDRLTSSEKLRALSVEITCRSWDVFPVY